MAENAGFWNAYLDAGENAADHRIAAALRHFGLEDLDRFSGGLPVGRTEAAARARPAPGCAASAVWLLDEPTASLDTASSERLVAAVNDHTKSGGLAVIATHLPLALERARTLDLAAQRVAA